MNITIYKLSGDYVCSGRSDEDFDIESACNQVFEEKLIDTLLTLYPEYKNLNITAKSEWIYEGYRMFIYGVKLSEEQVENILTKISSVTFIDYCDLFWEKDKFRTPYTGILLAYNIRNYHRISTGKYSFITLTYGGLDKFLKKVSINASLSSESPLAELINVTFAYIHEEDLEVTRQKLRGETFKPVRTKVIGRLSNKKKL